MAVSGSSWSAKTFGYWCQIDDEWSARVLDFRTLQLPHLRLQCSGSEDWSGHLAHPQTHQPFEIRICWRMYPWNRLRFDIHTLSFQRFRWLRSCGTPGKTKYWCKWSRNSQTHQRDRWIPIARTIEVNATSGDRPYWWGLATPGSSAAQTQMSKWSHGCWIYSFAQAEPAPGPLGPRLREKGVLGADPYLLSL